MPKALDPKSSASTNFATRPYLIVNSFKQSATHLENNSDLTYKKQKSRYYLFFFNKWRDFSCSFAINGIQKENSPFPFFSLCSLALVGVKRLVLDFTLSRASRSFRYRCHSLCPHLFGFAHLHSTSPYVKSAEL